MDALEYFWPDQARAARARRAVAERRGQKLASEVLTELLKLRDDLHDLIEILEPSDAEMGS